MIRELAFSIGFLATQALAGPDLTCSEINGATSYGFIDGNVAYSFGTTLCNIGDTPVSYVPTTNQHPLIVQSIYKLKDHRIEQIGIGFVRHTNIPLAGNACGLGCTPAGFDALGVGCSDSSSSSINGAQAMMGPRTEVNAQTGEYPYPFTSMGQAGDAIYKRVQVDLADVSDPDALYFVETQVIVPGELDALARNNNVSYRQVLFSSGSASATLVGPTYDQQPAIYAWRDHGNGIGITDDSVIISQHTIPDTTETYFLGSRASQSLDGVWVYDYEIFNLNSERGIEAVILELTGHRGSTFLDITMRSPRYHDSIDEDIPHQNWSSHVVNQYYGYFLRASMDPARNSDIETNYIRWGTMYGYSFEISTDAQPGLNEGLTLAFGITGSGQTYSATLQAMTPTSNFELCAADLSEDGSLNFFDVSLFLEGYLDGQDFNGDGSLNYFDVSAFLTEYNAGCP